MFTCTPAEALRQPWALTVAIMEYRMVRAGIDMLNDHKRGYDALMKYPEIAELLVEIGRIQGAYADAAQMKTYFRTDEPEKEPEPEPDMKKFKSITGA